MYKIVIYGLMFIMLYSCSHKEINSKILMYVGTSNGNPEKGIELCYFDTISGEISTAVMSAQILNPNYLEVDVENNILFSVGQLQLNNNNWLTPVVASYSVNSTSGELIRLSVDSTYGKDPCYVAYNSSTKKLYVANYFSGNVSDYTIQQGEIKYINSIQHYGYGPDIYIDKKDPMLIQLKMILTMTLFILQI